MYFPYRIFAMKLKDFLKIHNLTYREFAKDTGISPNCLWCYAHKKRHPSLKNANKIFKATRGMVTYQDLLN